jgi:hypothetical protein
MTVTGVAVLQPGNVFASDFRLVKLLSQGGMGAVDVVEQLKSSSRLECSHELPPESQAAIHQADEEATHETERDDPHVPAHVARSTFSLMRAAAIASCREAYEAADAVDRPQDNHGCIGRPSRHR